MPTRFDWSCFARISFLFVYLCNITYNLYIAVFSSFLLFCLQSKVYTLLWINSWQRWVGLWLLLTFQNGEYKKRIQKQFDWFLIRIIWCTNTTALDAQKSDFHTTLCLGLKLEWPNSTPFRFSIVQWGYWFFIMVRAIKWWKKLHLSTH